MYFLLKIYGLKLIYFYIKSDSIGNLRITFYYLVKSKMKMLPNII